jgi:hypothetical protein
VVLCFFGSAAAPRSARVLRELCRHVAVTEGASLFYGISTDPHDERLGRVRDEPPAIRFFWDFDRSISTLYHAAEAPCTVVLDERLRVAAVVDLQDEAAGPCPPRHVGRAGAVPPALQEPAEDVFAPVLVVPRIFEPGLCEALIGYHDQTGGELSGHDARGGRPDRRAPRRGLQAAP